MKVAVLGAGVIGVTTAYELMRDGHEVTVIDRCSAPAQETSFANAGLISPGHALPWASPGVPLVLLRSLYRNDQAFRMGFSLDPAFWRWSFNFLWHCNKRALYKNGEISYTLSRYSQARLDKVATDTGIDFHHQKRGLLYLHRQQQSLDEGLAAHKILREFGHEYELWDRNQIATNEPAFAAVKDKFCGGIYNPSDASGDCERFTRKLSEHCVTKGVKFLYNTEIKNLIRSKNGISGVQLGNQQFTADRYIIALGSYSPLLTKTIGLRIPVYPVKGYSMTLPITNLSQIPKMGGVDEHNLCSFSQLGDQLRVCATAEFAGYDDAYQEKNFRHLREVAKELFPTGVDHQKIEYWACLRPMTPFGTPIIKTTQYPNLFLNTGQGHLGWTQAAGSARILADLVAARKPEVCLANTAPF